MNSKLYVGELMHMRVAPVEHGFTYPMYVFALDLDELDKLDKQVGVFGYNRFRPLSLYDEDHLPGKTGSIKERLFSYLQDNGLTTEISRVELISSLRYFGRMFNPVSFYRCYSKDNSLLCVVAEVNNTFGETHLYILQNPVEGQSGAFDQFRIDKEFHVSPFFNMEGKYRFYFSGNDNDLDVRINMFKEDDLVFTSQMEGKPAPLTSRNVWSVLLKQPFDGFLTLPRITWQAFLLRFKKKLPAYTKPIAPSSMTIRKNPPSWTQKLAQRIVAREFSKLKKGKLILEYPDGQQEQYGDLSAEEAAVVRVKNYDFFGALVLAGDIGFGESYTDGYWEADDLTAVIRLFIDNVDEFDDRNVVTAAVGRWINRFIHLFHGNSKQGSRKNIQAHYDLGNEFFESFLDATMTYSCAQFENDEEDLEEAQRRKLHSILEKAQIHEGDHVLEIGSGWGSFAIEAVRQTNCRVTTITLSHEQKALVEKRIAESGLSDKITVKLCDYRDVRGSFDKIVSIEMIEAVGHKYLGKFFEVCDRVLKPNGVMALQVITIPDQRYEAYRKGCDWIQKYIFPGGLCPSLQVLSDALTSHSRFVIHDLENIGVDYATTLQKWRERFDVNQKQIRSLGFDERFNRIWNYYFSYCEAGFSSRTLNTLQLVLTRPNNSSLMP